MKTMTASLLCSAALALLAIAPGCDSAPVRNPRSTQTLVLSPDHAAPDVKMELVTALKVVLPGPEAGSDYTWVIGSNNTKVLNQTTRMTKVPASPAQGSAASTTVSFYAANAGRSELRFFLVRANSADAVPVASCAVTVRVED
jgi:hypothetical protein